MVAASSLTIRIPSTWLEAVFSTLTSSALHGFTHVVLRSVIYRDREEDSHTGQRAKGLFEKRAESCFHHILPFLSECLSSLPGVPYACENCGLSFLLELDRS